MAVMTSLYLSNRYVQACVGRPGARAVRVNALCDGLLPEGCLINGIVTGEAALAEALRGFWAKNRLPQKNVALVVESTQFLTKALTLPLLRPKKLAEVVRRELSTVETREDTLCDYLTLETDRDAKKQTVLAASAERAQIESYVSLALAAGFTLCSIDTALAAQLKLTALLPAFSRKTGLLLGFDGDNLTAVLLENGQYKYSSRSRLFSTHGTEAFGAEVGQFLSGVMQFQAAGKSGYAISDAYFANCSDEDLAVCAAACAALGLTAAPLPDSPAQAALPEGWHLARCPVTVGNLIGR